MRRVHYEKKFSGLSKMSFGLIGTGLVGGNLALNISKKTEINLYNRTPSRARELIAQNPNKPLICHETLEDMIYEMKSPRTIFTTTPQGSSTTLVVNELCDILSKDDVILDVSNDYFELSESRNRKCTSNDIGYLGIGISGGIAGILNNPTLTVGGKIETYSKQRDFLKGISDNVVYMGTDAGDGHYINMVHNGIEYAILQGMSDIFTYCNYDQEEFIKVLTIAGNTEMYGYLIENAKYTCKRFDLSNIDGKCEMNDSGLWCSIFNLKHGISAPMIIASVMARINSRHTFDVAQKVPPHHVDRYIAVGALMFVFSSSILEGYNMIYHKNIDEKLARRAWGNGTIIESYLLSRYSSASLYFNRNDHVKYAREVVGVCNRFKKSVPVLSAGVDNFDSERDGNMPLSLLMAQRHVFTGKGLKYIKN